MPEVIIGWQPFMGLLQLRHGTGAEEETGLQEKIRTLMVTLLRIITSRGLSMKCMPQ